MCFIAIYGNTVKMDEEIAYGTKIRVFNFQVTMWRIAESVAIELIPKNPI